VQGDLLTFCGTLTRPAAGLSQRERRHRRVPGEQKLSCRPRWPCGR